MSDILRKWTIEEKCVFFSVSESLSLYIDMSIVHIPVDTMPFPFFESSHSFILFCRILNFFWRCDGEKVFFSQIIPDDMQDEANVETFDR